ncbi:hypothetical protein AMECASPLE_006972, partial [Ameca splendens]
SQDGETQREAEEHEEDDYMPPIKTPKQKALEEPFEKEDSELLSPWVSVTQSGTRSPTV